MINVGIVGATGYVGNELMRILLHHPNSKIVSITSQSYAGQKYGEIFESFRHIDLICEEENIGEMADRCDVIFLALPHGVASKMVSADILAKTVIIDLGADYRLKDAATYEKWYENEHYSKELLEQAVYGLCEINREDIRGKRLIANPGCFTTCSILALYPLVKEGIIDPGSIVIDAKTGISGAGRGVTMGSMFCEVNENIRAYKIASHRHTPEIEEQLSYGAGRKITVLFTPHRVPMNRGILATCYAGLNTRMSYEEVRKIYEKYYGNERFVRLSGQGGFPETKWVKGTNFMDVGFEIDERTNRIIVIGAIDNLVKGAAGQAVQNMNILFGLDEKTGLEYIPVFPA